MIVVVVGQNSEIPSQRGGIDPVMTAALSIWEEFRLLVAHSQRGDVDPAMTAAPLIWGGLRLFVTPSQRGGIDPVMAAALSIWEGANIGESLAEGLRRFSHHRSAFNLEMVQVFFGCSDFFLFFGRVRASIRARRGSRNVVCHFRAGLEKGRDYQRL